MIIVRTVQIQLTDEDVSFLVSGIKDLIQYQREHRERERKENGGNDEEGSSWDLVEQGNLELITKLESQTFGSEAVVIKTEQFGSDLT
jgi:hypothetical protein